MLLVYLHAIGPQGPFQSHLVSSVVPTASSRAAQRLCFMHMWRQASRLICRGGQHRRRVHGVPTGILHLQRQLRVHAVPDRRQLLRCASNGRHHVMWHTSCHRTVNVWWVSRQGRVRPYEQAWSEQNQRYSYVNRNDVIRVFAAVGRVPATDVRSMFGRRRPARASGRLLAVVGELDGDPRLPPAQRLQVCPALESFSDMNAVSSLLSSMACPSEWPCVMLFCTLCPRSGRHLSRAAACSVLRIICRFSLAGCASHVQNSSTSAIAFPKRPAHPEPLRRYDNRSTVLGSCQTDWYDLDGDTSLTYEQLTAAQAALPCRLWGANYSDFACGSHVLLAAHQIASMLRSTTQLLH